MSEQHEALKQFGNQINYSVNNYHAHGLNATNYNAIIIAGLGGSGIGGQLVKAFFTSTMPVPVVCLADYNLPAFANEKTLVIAASYSGNTEETITVFNQAIERNCSILALSTGGKLAELAKQHNKYLLTMQGGFQPRMALGFSLTYLILLMGELIGKDYKLELQSAAAAVLDFQSYRDDALSLFNTIKHQINTKFVLLADAATEPIAIRFAQQVQENAKHECFVHTLPEMNHNVIESYYGKLNSLYFILNSGLNQRVTSRFEFIQRLLETENHQVINITMDQYNVVGVLELIHRLDWLSLFIADERGVDSLNVPNIASLKEFLG